MGTKKDETNRIALVHLLRSGKTPAEAALELSRARSWCYKWQDRFRREGWEGLKERSRAPHRIARKTSERDRQAILRTRSELEAEALQVDQLGYIGGNAIFGRLKNQGLATLPSVSTIERVLRQAGVLKPQLPKPKPETVYPTIRARTTHELTQVDIVPLWQETGLSKYVQFDNESCFSGGYKHPGVIGQAVRLALLVGIQPVFSPIYHPQSNAYVERFHQDYSNFVWKKVTLSDLADVRRRSGSFFPNYRRSQHHSELDGKSPQQIHFHSAARQLPIGFCIPKKLPISEGQVHFMRPVAKDHQVLILNKNWEVKLAEADQGVWATLFLTPKCATLRIYDAAPDVPGRQCLAEHPFPLKEPVVPLQKVFKPVANQQKNWMWMLHNFFRPQLATPSTMS
jgi:hypothetical protein